MLKAYDAYTMVIHTTMTGLYERIPTKCTNLADNSNCPFWP